MTEPTYRSRPLTTSLPSGRSSSYAYRGPESAKGWSSEAHLPAGERTSFEEVTELYEQPDTRFLLAEADDVLVGCVLIEKHGEEGYFGMFSVNPHLQNGGLGRALLDRAEQSVPRPVGRQGDDCGGDRRSSGAARAGTSGVATCSPANVSRFPFDEHTGALRTDFGFVKLRKPL